MTEKDDGSLTRQRDSLDVLVILGIERDIRTQSGAAADQPVLLQAQFEILDDLGLERTESLRIIGQVIEPARPISAPMGQVNEGVSVFIL